MFTIWFVCSGNRCRSPYAEAVLRQLLEPIQGVAVGSVGVLDLPDHPVPSELTTIASGMGLDLSGHRSRHMTREALRDADLVLGFEHGHKAAAVVDGGVPSERVFGLVELVRLLDSIPDPEADDPLERARVLIAHAHAARRKDGDFVPGEEVNDPFGATVDGYRAAAARIDELCETLARRLFARENDPAP